jgi:hypothetical protein
MGDVVFDTCVYHQPSINLLFEVIDADNILFGSEMIGAVRGTAPHTGHHFDDTRRYVDALGLAPGARAKVYELNARRGIPPPRRASLSSGPVTQTLTWILGCSPVSRASCRLKSGIGLTCGADHPIISVANDISGSQTGSQRPPA